jgi:hypothetical protein
MSRLLLSILASSTLALVSQPASAQDIGGGVEVLQSTDGQTVATATYNWRSGKLDGFGFVDVFPNGGPLDFLTSHTVNYEIDGPVFASAEIGATNFGQTVRAGVGVNLPVPGMRFTRVTAYPFVQGDGDRRQVKVTWMSEDLRISDDVSVYTTGFARFRDGAPDVAQPQFLVKIDDVPVEFGAEVGFFGSQTSVSAMIRMSF